VLRQNGNLQALDVLAPDPSGQARWEAVMDVSSRGFRYWTTYEPEGDQARITANYMREQTQAGTAAYTGFHLDAFGLGGGFTIRVRATTRQSPPTIMVSAVRAPTTSEPMDNDRHVAGPAAARMAAARRPHRPVLTSPSPQGAARRGRDGGLFDPWEDPLPEWIGPDPFPPQPEPPPQPPPGGGGSFLHTQVRIELYAPGVTEPVQTWELPQEYAGNYREVKYTPPQGYPAPDAPVRRIGWWRVVVTPTSGLPAMIRLEASAILKRVPFRTKVISKRLADHLFRVVLEALVPGAFVDGTRLKVSIGEELAREFGIPRIVVDSPTPFSISSPARLKSLNIRAESGRNLKEFASTKSRHPIFLPRVQDNDAVIRIEAAFCNGTFTAHGFDLGRLNGEFGVLFLAFSRDFQRLSVISYLDVDFSHLVDTFLTVASVFTELNHDIVNTKIEDVMMQHEPEIRAYFREVLSRAVGERAVATEVWFGGGGWQVRYFDDPPMPNPDTPWHHWVDTFGGSVGGIGGLVDPEDLQAINRAAPGTIDPGVPPGDTGANPTGSPTNDPLGEFPSDFLHVDDPVALQRLDRHQSIVVIMMENRSYDHLLGRLTAAQPSDVPEENYGGPPANAANAPCGAFRDRVPLVPAEKLGLGTAIPVDPRHFTAPTAFQMGDGSTREEAQGSGDMQGFARDLFANRSDSPQLVMTMYGEQHLPTYYKLAHDFCVADHWFCAHPGPTWPNRYATILGLIPILDNHKIDDPTIGFLKHYSIFDALTAHGIEWKVFESDLSLVRTFDRYRLDDRRVVPLRDPDDGLEATLSNLGRPLPRVMFIEPNFADLPPLATANDDHPPTDLAVGQDFIAEMCDLIWRYRWSECLVCITYDEHGGIYDHVPPPGTKKGDPAFLGKIKKLHPKGPEFLGPRVPTFILSPYVSAHKANHTVFDHTSILKSILVHNRSSFTRSSMAVFGPRAADAAHLGEALNLDTPRQRPQPFDPSRWQLPPGGRFGEIVNLDGMLVTDTSPGETPAAPPAATPRPVKLRAPTGLSTGESDEPDFHAALRRMLAPRH
jgi:phospholipase C